MQPPRLSPCCTRQPMQEKKPTPSSSSSQTEAKVGIDQPPDTNTRYQEKRSCKRRKAASFASCANKRKRVGKLQNLPEMPLDILFEIFAHLVPADLIRLSRTTKALRGLLMRRSTAFLWKQVRENFIPALPPCPPQLCEPEYANLVFDPHCHFCGSPRVKLIRWFFFKRVCKPCEKIHMVACHRRDHNFLVFVPDLMRSGVGVQDLKECLPIYAASYFKTELSSFLLAYASISDEEEKAEWKRISRAEIKQRKDFATAGRAWQNDRSSHNQQQLANIRAQRSAAILARMRQDGWNDVIENFNNWERYEFSNHEVVEPSKVLTDRTWAKIQPEIVNLFTQLRADQHSRLIPDVRRRRITTFGEAFESYCHTLPYDFTAAPLANVAMMDSVQGLIQDERLDYVPSFADFHSAFSNIPEMTAQWKDELDQHLYHLIGATTPDSLQLATSLFDCGVCGVCNLSYKRVLAHTHTERPSHLSIDTYPREIRDWLTQLRCWPADPSKFSLVDTRYVKAILQTCHLSEEKTTMDELEELDPLLWCLVPQCYHDKQQPDCFHVASWHAFLGFCFRPSNDPDPHSTLMMIKSGDLFDSYRASREDYGDAWENQVFACMHCYSAKPMYFSDVQKHLEVWHDITIQKESTEHYTLHPSCGPKWCVLYSPRSQVSNPVPRGISSESISGLCNGDDELTVGEAVDMDYLC